ncbi:hypothetical protein V3C99_017118, partial [Haemonchus contortus]
GVAGRQCGRCTHIGSEHRFVRAKIRLRAQLQRRDDYRSPPIRLPQYDTIAMEYAAAQYTCQEHRTRHKIHQHINDFRSIIAVMKAAWADRRHRNREDCRRLLLVPLPFGDTGFVFHPTQEMASDRRVRGRTRAASNGAGKDPSRTTSQNKTGKQPLCFID